MKFAVWSFMLGSWVLYVSIGIHGEVCTPHTSHSVPCESAIAHHHEHHGYHHDHGCSHEIGKEVCGEEHTLHTHCFIPHIPNHEVVVPSKRKTTNSVSSDVNQIQLDTVSSFSSAVVTIIKRPQVRGSPGVSFYTELVRPTTVLLL